MPETPETLREIVRALGGELYDGGRRASVPAPGHSATDRSVSLLLSKGRIVVHSFGEADWKTVRDDLRRRGLIESEYGAPRTRARVEPAPRPAPPDARARVDVARRLWSAGQPVTAASVAAAYARRRAIARDLTSVAALRLHPAAPLRVYDPGERLLPALMAAVLSNEGKLCAIELTYLAAGGRRAEGLRVPRKTVGVLPRGCAVRLEAAGPSLLVAEGIFTALSAGERFGLSAWALLSASRMAAWTPPPGIERLLIAADRDAAGEAAAAALAGRASGLGIGVTVRLPPLGRGDWNDLAVQEAKGGSGRATVVRGKAPGGGPERDP